jgi:hypothetical protein
MELNGLGPKSLKDNGVQTAKKTEVVEVTAPNKDTKSTVQTNTTSEVVISQTAQKLLAQELKQRTGAIEPQNPKLKQLKESVNSGKYPEMINNKQLADNILKDEKAFYTQQ